jgi:hypothetical protein
MRRVVLFVGVVAGAFSSLAVCGQGATREYDRFKNQTSYEAEIKLSELSANSPGISLELAATTTGDSSIGKADRVSLTATVTYDMTRPSACAGAGVDALVDGKPLSLDKAMPPFFYGGHAIVGSKKELTYAQVEALANSKVAEFRICGEVHTLTPEQTAAFKKFMVIAQQPAA